MGTLIKENDELPWWAVDFDELERCGWRVERHTIGDGPVIVDLVCPCGVRGDGFSPETYWYSEGEIRLRMKPRMKDEAIEHMLYMHPIKHLCDQTQDWSRALSFMLEVWDAMRKMDKVVEHDPAFRVTMLRWMGRMLRKQAPVAADALESFDAPYGRRE